VLIAVLQAWRVKGAILIGILLATAAGWALGLAKIVPATSSLADLTATAFKMDVAGAFNLKGGIGLACWRSSSSSCSSTCSTMSAPWSR
jgi:AGZA family xanthine/uracil permease-like MFS transporter